jgi:hypothetical protein
VLNAIPDDECNAVPTLSGVDAGSTGNLPVPSVTSSDLIEQPAVVDDIPRACDAPDSPPCAPTPVIATPVSRCGSVGVTLGTPLALEVTEEDCDTDSVAVKKLPERSLFAVGVSDHILYENLPNATGTFQRLRGVLRTLRETGTQQRRDNSPHATPNSATRH